MATGAYNVLWQMEKDRRDRRELDETKQTTLAQTLGAQAKDIAAVEGETSVWNDIARGANDPVMKKGGWEATFHAITKGMGDASKRERAQKLLNTMQKLRDYNQHVFDTRREVQEEQLATEAIAPQLTMFLESSDKLAPEQREKAMQEIVGIYAKARGKNLELASIDGANPFKVTVLDKDTGVHSMVDLSGKGSFGESIYERKRQERFAADIQRMIEQERADNLELKRMQYINVAQKGAEATLYKQMLLEQRKEAAINNLNAKLTAAENQRVNTLKEHNAALMGVRAAESMVNNIKEILEISSKPKNKALFQTFTADAWANSKNRGAFNTAMRRFTARGKDGAETVHDLNRMKDLMSGMSIDSGKHLASVFKNPSVQLLKLEKEGFHNENMSMPAVIEKYKRLLPELERAATDSRAGLNELENTLNRTNAQIKNLSSMILGSETPSLSGGIPSAVEATPSAIPAVGGTVKLQDPSTGEVMEVTKEEAEELIGEFANLKVIN